MRLFLSPRAFQTFLELPTMSRPQFQCLAHSMMGSKSSVSLKCSVKRARASNLQWGKRRWILSGWDNEVMKVVESVMKD
ncbi:hypothetical protein K1719_021946 [Acacia pycnantha]|nr:hypothetical protein K1719_021946 [Acacia pycnantha]